MALPSFSKGRRTSELSLLLSSNSLQSNRKIEGELLEAVHVWWQRESPCESIGVCEVCAHWPEEVIVLIQVGHLLCCFDKRVNSLLNIELCQTHIVLHMHGRTCQPKPLDNLVGLTISRIKKGDLHLDRRIPVAPVKVEACWRAIISCKTFIFLR